MRTWTVGDNDAGRRLDRFLSKAAPALSAAHVQKAIRTRHVKVDGRRAEGGTRLAAGQTVTLYEDAAPAAGPDLAHLARPYPPLAVVFDDANLLVLDKPSGLPVQPDGLPSTPALASYVQAYLFQRGDWDPARENTFAPAPAHRIDRHTSGLVLFAKNAEALRILTEKFRLREIEKSYCCLIHGTPDAPAGTLRHCLRRDETRSRVSVRPDRRDGAKTAVTAYRVLLSRNGLSLVECRPLTGRTHQIRAQWAAVGHPLLGDGKYADNRADRALGWTHQALHAHTLTLAFQTPAGRLDPLRGRVFEAPPPPWVAAFTRDEHV
ncbi:MAG: RluA family pseudouridine synthase [Oscillospiraceae bacterium]|jgi:23S rRNA pseudouridine955/2504/2580 synthase|nr:RluA family pseudouridine synthase [Oscillospiraceae bacterium]